MKKAPRVFVPILAAAAFLAAGLAPVHARDSYSFEKWYQMTIPKTNIAFNFMTQTTYLVPEFWPAWTCYGPEGIVYADKIIRHDIKDPDALLDLDLILRVVPALDGLQSDRRLSWCEASTPFATVLTVHGEHSRDDLNNLRIASLEVMQGKIYVGVEAFDPYQNSDGSMGTNDTFRRRLYVTESVADGTGVSRPFHGGLANAILKVEGILPGAPHIEGEPFQEDPTNIVIQVRSAATEVELEAAPFTGHYELDGGSGYSEWELDFPLQHTWFQYKMLMATSDSRVTPVLERVRLETAAGTLVDDNDWSAGQLVEVDDLLPSHSPGNVVLANRKLLTGQVAMALVRQPPCVEPPAWCWEIDPPDRAFRPDDWPYRAVGDMEALDSLLVLSVGEPATFHTGCKAGDFLSYDYRSGLFQLEEHFYHERIPGDLLDKTYWGEGSGWFKTMAGMAVMNQPDTKIGIWIPGLEVWTGTEAEEVYVGTFGDGEWQVGYTPASIGVGGQAPFHIHDMVEFEGYYFASTNRGVIYRPVPRTPEDHKDTTAWSLFCCEPSGPMMAAAFNIFDRHLLIDYYVNEDDYSVTFGRMAVNPHLEVILESKFTESTYSLAILGREYEGHLVYWDKKNHLHYTAPRFRAIPLTESLHWRQNAPVLYRLRTEGGQGPYRWSLLDGALPEGVVLNEQTGMLAGVPTDAGAFDVAFRVTDGLADPAPESSVAVSIVVHEAP
ncbi:MAG: Ig domain-containing protein [Planctomycetota bacterium]